MEGTTALLPRRELLLGAPKSPARGPWLLVLPVLALHALLAAWWPPADRFGLGEDAGAAAPPRIEVAFVRELKAAPPPPAPVRRLAPTRRLRAIAPVAAAASGAASLDEIAAAETPPPWPAEDSASALLPTLNATALPAIAALPPPGATPSPAQEAASAAGFEWPPSTRLSYTLSGNYRGPVEGQARVEWRLAGERYQVALEVSIGPPFAPLLTRQLLSDGFVTAAGLAPQRYDETTQMVLRAPRRLSIALDAEAIALPSGRRVPRPAGVQDSASQFVQMTWLFTTQPERLRAGQTIELPLALPRHVQDWVYEVVGEERLATPLGELDAVHVRPRRVPQGAGGGGGDLVAEFWVAPTLQYLPVRIVIRQDEQTWVDLQLQRAPQQAVRDVAPPALTRR